MKKKVFISRINFSDAEYQARMAGYESVGRVKNKRGEYVVFGQRKNWG